MSDTENNFSKLEAIKKTREKSRQLSDVSNKLADAVGFFTKESLHISEYEAELEILQQERLYHLEQLRLIEKDIAAVEQTIFEARIDKIKTLKLAHRLSSDYGKLLSEVNLIRSDLGLMTLEDKRSPEAVALTQAVPTNAAPTPLQIRASDASGGPPFSQCLKSPQPSSGLPPVLPPSSANPSHEYLAAWLASFRQDDQFNWSKQFRSEAADANEFSSNNIRKAQNSAQSLRLNDLTSRTERETNLFSNLPGSMSSSTHVPSHHSQQAPPMKTCQSCQQLIHRNAPICPLCKTKSRSRHPKRPTKARNNPSVPPSSSTSNAPTPATVTSSSNNPSEHV
ncbi:hypothetical protein Aperf_G00000011178 [Anoplocephala perfoliata]